MFSIGEYIVHPGQGVCKVADIEEGPEALYKLLPVAERHPMLISFPVASESRLRPVVTRDEATALIKSYPELEPDTYTDRSNALEEQHFKKQIKQGSLLDSVRVAKTFRRRIAEVEARNKKPPVAYERILKEAQDRSLLELAVALDSTTEDVRHMFELSAADKDELN